jgi:hypothetical protein
MDPYSVIPSTLRDDPHGPVPMDANINISAKLEAYPTTLLMTSSGPAHDFLNDAELGHDFGIQMNDIRVFQTSLFFIPSWVLTSSLTQDST